MTAATPSRFSSFGPWYARAVLAFVVILIDLGFGAGTRPPPAAPAAVATQHDAYLYRAIATRVGNGHSYYAAAAAEQRARGFPLRPFVTMRPPLLAHATARVGTATMGLLFQLLAFVTLGALALRFRIEVRSMPVWLAAIGLSALSLLIVAQPGLAIWHEAWAAVLITLALAMRTRERWAIALAAGLTAALVRELAIPFLLVMAVAAFAECRRREGSAWLAAFAAVGIALAVHASAVAAVVLPTDGVSQGWAGGGGWGFVVGMIAQSSAFAILPIWAVALLVPLALIGWIEWRHPLGVRAALWLCGMVAVFTLLGRPDNFYWGMMLAPLLPIGLAFAPRAIVDLVRAAR